MIEAALPAKVLRDDAVATWVREHGAAVDVHTSEELAIAIANGVEPSRILVHGDELGETELRAVATLGVGPTCNPMSVSRWSATTAAIAMSAVSDPNRKPSVGGNEQACVSFPAAIGEMVASMDQIHRRYGTVLTRLGLDCDLWPGDWATK